MFCNGRHYRVMLIITMQYPLGIPPNLRTNVDFAFIFRQDGIGDRRRIYDNYAGMFSSFELFCQFLDSCTSGRECMVVDNTTDSANLADKVFYYKAKVHPKFTIGTQRDWAESQAMRPLTALDEDDGNISNARKGPRVNITRG